MSIETVEKPRPPAWPEKGTPEYEERLQKMRAGHAKRLQKAKKPAPTARTAPPVEEADLIDVGDPGSARMAPDPKPEKGKPKAASRGKAEFDQGSIHKNLKLGLDILARMPSHEHWHRDDDEIELIAEPATRCLNRLDKKLIEKLRTVSDPAALIFACVMVLGPSVMEEIRNVRPQPSSPRSRPAQQPAQQPAHQPQREAEPGPGGFSFADPPTVSSNGASPLPAVADLPAVGI